MPSTVSSKSPEALLSTSLLPIKFLRRGNNNSHHRQELPPLNLFIANVFQRSQLPPCVCLVSLIYLQRLKSCLPTHASGETDTPYRLFLAATLTASKFLSDTNHALTNQSMVVMTDFIYTLQDINCMERSFLKLIRYQLFVSVDIIKDYLAIHGKRLEMDLVDL
ncbi:cyclin domain-containing protein [Sporodiniella umbellata]|nr:cyclin domain-containing protein [Sporodiniella umbellata]